MAARDEDDDSNAEQRGRWGAAVVGATIVLLPLAYLFLLGPAVRYHDDCPEWLQATIEYGYYPLEWLHRNTPLKSPLEWYVNLWQR